MLNNNLPEWDLTDIYPAQDSSEIEADFQRAHKLSKNFNKRYKGKSTLVDLPFFIPKRTIINALYR